MSERLPPISHARDCAYVVNDGPAPCTCDFYQREGEAIEALAPAPASSVGEGDTLAIVWKAAMTAACNIAIDEQNRANDDDAPSRVLEAQGEIIRRIKGLLHLDADYREELQGMLAATPDRAPAPADLVEALADVQRRIALWPDRAKHPPNGGTEAEWAPFYDANRARSELEDRLPDILAALRSPDDLAKGRGK